jgi:2-polyprenyl-6-methoxyphenol hydroxylase-like FAD-dependent oxidoreductase
MHVKETGGGAVRFDASLLAVPALAWIVDVPALEARLAQAVRFQPQISLLESPADATLSVICEGRASVSRQLLGVEQEVMPYAQVAIAARLSAELPHQQVACQWFTPQDILGLLPMGGEGGNLLAAVWSIPADQKQQWLDAPQDMFEDRLFTASEGRFGRLRLARCTAGLAAAAGDGPAVERRARWPCLGAGR